MQVKTERAKPLSSEDRRAAIIDAVIPLLMSHGREVTTKQIAEAAGVAEGTIFRVFDDKDSLIEAAVAKFLDPEKLHAGMRAIDPSLSLEQKVVEILGLLQARMTGMFGMMAAVGRTGRPPVPRGPNPFFPLLEEVLQPDLDDLGVAPERAAGFLRLVAFASAVPQFNQGQEIPSTELAHMITHGISGK